MRFYKNNNKDLNEAIIRFKNIIKTFESDRTNTISEQSVVGAPSYGVASTYEPQDEGNLIDDYEEFEIPYPSKNYGNIQKLKVPKNGRYNFFNSAFELKFKDFDPLSADFLSSLRPGMLRSFVTPDNKWWKTYWSIDREKNTIQLIGYIFEENGQVTEYKEENYIKLPEDEVNWHSVLDIIELSTAIIGFFAGPAAGIFFTISSGAAFTNAYLYLKEGHKYTATIYALFGLLGVAPLIKMGIKAFSKYTFREIALATEALDKGSKLTGRQKQILKELEEQMAKNQTKIMVALAEKFVEQTFKKMVPNLAKLNINLLKNVVLQTVMFGVVSVVVMGGVYTLDEIWMALDASSAAEIEKNSPARRLWSLLNGENSEQVLQETLKALEEKTQEMAIQDPEKFSNPKQLVSYDSEKGKEYSEKFIEYAIQKNSESSEGLTYENVKNGVINKKTNTPYVFKYGDKGPEIKKLNTLLKQKYPDLYIQDTPSDIYDYYTMSAVNQIQEKNNLGVEYDGRIVDSKTINLIEKNQ